MIDFSGPCHSEILLSEENCLTRYYMAKQVGHLFNVRTNPNNVSNNSTPYYEYTIETIKKCKDHKKFPDVKPKDIYEMILPQSKPGIENNYDFNWKNIWKQLNFRHMNINHRNIMFKYIYEILPTNHRLAQIRIKDSPLCEYCDMDDTNSHKFYHCCMIQECILWLRKVLFYICGIQTNSLLKILYLDLPRIDKRNMNSLCVIISCYISTVWFNKTDLRYIKNIVKASILKMQKFHKVMLNSKMEKIFSEKYCNLDIRIFNNI